MKDINSMADEYIDNNIMAISIREREETKKRKIYPIIKRIIDICAGIAGSLIAIPIWGIIKVSYIINKDFAPVIFKQKRIGKDGKQFSLYKFRTMVHNADDVLKELLKEEKYWKEWKKNQKFHKDPRITKCGGFLRKTSLDEMPQFFNILRNDMSLIGPRPLVEGELEEHNGNAEIYQSVKPGISGLWACSGRSEIGYDERLKLEYLYAENLSFKMDMKCVFGTIAAVVLKKGAK